MSAPAEATVTKSVMETYTIRNNHEHATIALRCWDRKVNGGKDTYYCGEILINSTFGSWANIWTACGNPFKEFLVDAEFDYIFTKFMGTRLRVFDGDMTVKKLKMKVIEERRSGNFSKDEARDLWREINEFNSELTHSVESFVHAMRDIAGNLSIGGAKHHAMAGEFEEPWYCTEDKYHPQAVGFWREIWPHFIAELKKETGAMPA